MLGMLPLEGNEEKRDTKLRNFVHPKTKIPVKDYPINRKGGGSASEMRPYVDHLMSVWQQLLELEHVDVRKVRDTAEELCETRLRRR